MVAEEIKLFILPKGFKPSMPQTYLMPSCSGFLFG
jgi:hypothetical protein